jgi:glutaredoxin 3
MLIRIGRNILMAIEIYSKDNCSFCDQAKQMLRIHGKDFVEYKLDEDFTREVLLSKFPEAKTFPIIVLDGFNIGGFEQLKKHLTEETTDNRKILLETDYFGA